MMRLTKRALSAFLAFVMVFTMLPLDTWAAGISGLGGSTQSGGERIPIDPNSIAAYAETSEDVPHSENYKEMYVGDTWPVRGSWTIGPGSDEYVSYGGNKFTALKPGLAIIVNQGSQEVDPYTMAIRVLPVETPANAIILSAETLNFTGRETKTLTATVTPEGADQSVTWESSNTAVAVVDAAGNVTSTGEGTATITAKSKDNPAITAECAVTVTDVRQLTGITLQNLSLVAGQTGYMEITFEPAEPLNYVTEWSVENEEIAAVGSDGKITAKQDGHTTVTVKVNGNQSAQAALTVGKYVPVTQITLNKTAVTLQGTKTYQLEATVNPDNATDKVVWSSTNPEFATVDENGLVTAVAPGKTSIVAEAGGRREVCTVTVEPLESTGTTPVYVYLKLNFESEVQGSGWTPNKDGWYTIGVMYVPSDILSAPDQAYMSGDMDKVLEYLPFIQYFNGYNNNLEVASAIDLTTITWEKLLSASGAADYGDTEGNLTWHLDGYYSIKNTQSTLTVHYVDLYGSKIAEPFTQKVNNATNVTYGIPKIPGYTLDNINGTEPKPGQTQGEAVVIGDTDVYVYYRTDKTYYTVKHVDMEDKSVVLATEIIPNAKPGNIIRPNDIEPSSEFPEYHYDSMSITEDGLMLQEDPALNVVYVYYVRIKYDVTYTFDGVVPGGVTEPNGGSYAKDERFNVATVAEREGYKFLGWTYNGGTYDPGTEFTMPNNDVEFVGTWTKTTANYTVKYLFEMLDGKYEENEDYRAEKTGNIGEKTAAEALPYPVEGFTAPTNIEQKVITEDGETVVEVKYTRNRHKVTYQITGDYFADEAFHVEEDVPYGKVLTPLSETMEKDGYIWSRWNPEQLPATMPDKDVVVTGFYTIRNDLQYTIKYVWFGDPNKEIGNPEVVNNQKFGSTVTLDNRNLPEIDGYTLIDQEYSVEISADNDKNVIRVYYRMNVVLTANSGETIYNGTEQKVEGFTVRNEEDESITGAVFTGVSASGKGTHAGDYTVEVTGAEVNKTLDKDKKYLVTKVENGTLKIKPIQITLTSGTQEWYYDGQEHSNTVVTQHGQFLEGEGFVLGADGNPEFTNFATITNVGQVNNKFTYPAFNGKTVETDYEIKVNYGTLTVKTSYKVTYQFTGEVPTNASELLPAGEYNLAPDSVHEVAPILSQEGYIFDGWYLDGKKVTSNTLTIGNSDIVLEGKWTKLYKLSYNGNAPEGTTVNLDDEVYADQYYDDGTEVKLAPAPEAPDGYVFGGWKIDDQTLQAGIDYAITQQDVTAYAVWNPRKDLSYTIEYYWVGKPNEHLIDSQTVGGQTFGDTIILTDEDVAEIAGYTPIVEDPNPHVTEITTDESKNVIKVYYYKNVVLQAEDTQRVYTGDDITVEVNYTGVPAGVKFGNIVPSGTGKYVGEYDISFPKGTLNQLDELKRFVEVNISQSVMFHVNWKSAMMSSLLFFA